MTPHPYSLLHASFSDFWQNQYFSKKMFYMSLTAKKVDYIFEKPLNLRLILVSFFLFRRGFQEKIESSWRNYSTWGVEEHNASDTQNTITIFLSEIAVLQVIFLTDIISALFVIVETHSDANSKSLQTSK